MNIFPRCAVDVDDASVSREESCPVMSIALRPRAQWGRAIPLSQGWRVRASVFCSKGELEEVKKCFSQVGELKVVNGEELEVESKAGLGGRCAFVGLCRPSISIRERPLCSISVYEYSMYMQCFAQMGTTYQTIRNVIAWMLGP